MRGGDEEVTPSQPGKGNYQSPSAVGFCLVSTAQHPVEAFRAPKASQLKLEGFGHENEGVNSLHGKQVSTQT